MDLNKKIKILKPSSDAAKNVVDKSIKTVQPPSSQESNDQVVKYGGI